MRRFINLFTRFVNFLPLRSAQRTRLILFSTFTIVALAASIYSLIVRADNTPQTLPFSQNWSNAGLITTNDIWSGVPGIEGFFLRNEGTATTAVNPQTILGDTFGAGTTTVEPDVNANRSDPDTFSTGGATEFDGIANPVVALAGSGTADAPFIIINLNTTGFTNVNVAYNLRDVDGSADNAVQPVALQYRVGSSGSFTNLASGFVADATSGPGLATLVTPVSVTLPAAAENQGLVQLRIMTTNAAGNDEWVGIDDISITAGGGNMLIIPACPASLTTAAGTATSGSVSATDADGTVTGASISGITPTNPGTITLDSFTPAAIVGGTATATLNVGAATPAGSYSAVITWTNNDVPTPQTATCTVAVTVIAGGNTLIHDIQGTTDTPNLSGMTVSVQGVVVGDFQTATGLAGFFVEEENADWDLNANTSEGIFVADPAAFVNVAVGDKVTVTGTVANTFGLTQISPTTSVIINASGEPLPNTQLLSLPVAAVSDFEKFEGMRVAFDSGQVITDTNELGRFGEFTVSGSGRLFQPTNLIDPNDNPASGTSTSGNSNVPVVTAQQNINDRSKLIVDDGSNVTNTGGLAPIPFIGPGPNATLRPGDVANGLVGVMNFAFSNYRLEVTAAPVFVTNNPRPAAPPSVGSGNIRVASFNVENYFLGPFPDPTGRGASNAAEFTRQRDKLVEAMRLMDADVIGLIELEKAGGNAVAADFAAGLTAAMGGGANTYAAVADLGTLVGTDTEIKNGMIYRTSKVTTVGGPLTDTVAAAGTYSRDPLAQRFQVTGGGQQFFVTINHFRSRSCSGASGADLDQGDGQGCFNARRKGQATALTAFINNTLAPVDPDVVIIGDINAYSEEDPLDTFRAAGFKDVLDQFVAAGSRYSFLFDQQVGSLDGAFVTPSLISNVTGASIWHINVDEPDIFDYNTENKPDDRYAVSPFRSADHDPLLIGLSFGAGCPTITVGPMTIPNGAAGLAYGPVQFTQMNGGGTITWSVSSNNLPAGLSLGSMTGILAGTPTVFGTFNITVRATDAGNCFGERTYMLLINPPCGTITVNPATVSNGFVGTVYSATFSGGGGTQPYTFTLDSGTLPNGLSLSAAGALTGTPTVAGAFNFTIKATDAAGCMGTLAYTAIISGNGLQFYPLPTPLRLLDTRNGASPNACSQPNAPIAGGTSLLQQARSFCGLPANAQAITGNVTTVQSGGGYLTLYPSDAAQPTVASTNYGPSQVVNNVFTVGLGAVDGAFKIFALTTTEVVVDVTGYYAPPGTGGLFFHPLPAPVRLLETRAGQSVGCVLPGAPLVGGADSTQQAIIACTGIPAAARAIVGNATTVGPQGIGYLTLFPAGASRPLVASSNYETGQVVNGPFTVGLSPSGEFKIFTSATTDLVVDVLGYYSPEAVDANGAGLLFSPLRPVRLLETRAGQPVGCFKPNAPLNGGQTYTQSARGMCDGVTVPNNALGVVGNATVVRPQGVGYLTLWPSSAAQPTTATANFSSGQAVNRHFIVGLGSGDGAFKMFSNVTTDLVIDLSGYFAP